MKNRTVALEEVTEFMDGYCAVSSVCDYPGSFNGLQFQNSGKVTKIATAVDAGLSEIRMAAHIGADLLIVHHGIFWEETRPVVGHVYEACKILIDSDIAVYSMHLPLDAHDEIGNNTLMAKALGLKASGRCFESGGVSVGVVARAPAGGVDELENRLRKLFPKTFKRIRFGSKNPKRIALCSGSCGDVVPALPKLGIDTLVCGELRQKHFRMAQEYGLNLYPCGHYATETFGVIALGEIAAKKFALPCDFIEMANPL